MESQDQVSDVDIILCTWLAPCMKYDLTPKLYWPPLDTTLQTKLHTAPGITATSARRRPEDLRFRPRPRHGSHSSGRQGASS